MTVRVTVMAAAVVVVVVVVVVTVAARASFCPAYGLMKQRSGYVSGWILSGYWRLAKRLRRRR